MLFEKLSNVQLKKVQSVTQADGYDLIRQELTEYIKALKEEAYRQIFSYTSFDETGKIKDVKAIPVARMAEAQGSRMGQGFMCEFFVDLNKHIDEILKLREQQKEQKKQGKQS